MFAEVRDGLEVPRTDERRAIDYRRVAIGVDHVLASSAIPALFAPIEIDGRWYMDGGVRLNVPLKPAIELGATELAVVATHSATYEGAEPPPSGHPRTHDVIDGVVAVLGAVLADRMVEDLHTLEKVNELVGRGGAQEDHKEIPYTFVGPDTRHEIGGRAAQVYQAHFAGFTCCMGSTCGCCTASSDRGRTAAAIF